MSRPTKYPQFAINDVNDPVSSQPNVSEPGQALKDSGWTRRQKPYRQHFNWLHRITDDWIEWFDSLIDSNITASSTIINQSLKTTDSPSFTGLSVNNLTISASGTPVSVWGIDNDAAAYPQLKNDSGALRIRNHLDNDDADLIVKNLTVNGTTTTINSETLAIADNIILLNSDVTGTPTQDGGIEIERGDLTNASLIWDEGADSWKAGIAGSEVQLADINYQGVWDVSGTINYYNGGNVGIGTATPTYKLHVVGTTYISDVLTVNGTIGIVADTDLLALTSGLLTVNGNENITGNVGIGIASSVTGLEINNEGNIFGGFKIHTDAGGDYSSYLTMGRDSPNAAMRFVMRARPSVGGIWGSGTEVMTILGSGNVGIGTATPSVALEVVGSEKITGNLSVGNVTNVSNGAGLNNIRIKNNNLLGSTTHMYQTCNSYSDGSKWVPFTTAGASLLVLDNTGILTFSNAPSHATEHTFVERFRITADGNVGIGTATPINKLDILTTSNDSFRIKSNIDAAIYTYIDSNRSTSGVILCESFFSWNGTQVASIQSLSGSNTTAKDDGSLAFRTKATGGTIGTRMFIDSSGNVGIGTTTPDEKLHVVGDIHASTDIYSNTSCQAYNSTEYGTYIGLFKGVGSLPGYPSNYYPVLKTDFGAMYFSVNGKYTVGLGYDATIDNSFGIINNAGVLKIQLATGGVSFFNGGNVGIGTATPATSLDIYTNGVHSFMVGGTEANLYDSSGGQKIRLSTDNSYPTFFNAGNVGIGTTTPTYKLHVEGDCKVTNIFIADTGLIKTTNGSSGIQLRNAGSISIYNDSTEKMTITTTGNVGIGTATPSVALHVVGNGRFTAIGSGASAGAVHYTSDGTLTTNTSDYRLKKEIESLSSVLVNISKLNPVSFKWRENDKEMIGLIAQEVEKVFPLLTFTNPIDGYMGIHYAEFTSVLIKAVQELMIKNQELIGRLEKLENKEFQFFL